MGNSASSLPYSIGNQIYSDGGWSLHEGTQKSDGSRVSVFVAKKPQLLKTPVNASKSPQQTQLEPALHHFQQCKRLRHPQILQVQATLDTDHPTETAATAVTTSNAAKETGDLIIVTEACIPLEAWLATHPPPEQVAWGLESIVGALHFLHASANLAHGDLSPHSFFVTLAGDVKVWNFSLVTPVSPSQGGLSMHFRDWEGLVTPQPYRSPERVERRFDDLTKQEGSTHAMDSYGLGVLVGYLYNDQIPAPLQKAVQRLLTPTVRLRPRLQPLLKCPLFDTPHQKLQLQLEEFLVAPIEQKIAFWQDVLPQLQAGLIGEQVARYKLLPLMKMTLQTTGTNDSLKAQEPYKKESEWDGRVHCVVVS